MICDQTWWRVSTPSDVPLCSGVSISVTKLLPPYGPWDPYPRSGYSKRLLSIDCTSCFFVIFTHTNPHSRFCVRCHHPLFKIERFTCLSYFWCVPMGSILEGWNALRWFGEVVYLVMWSFSRWSVIWTPVSISVHLWSRVLSLVTKLLPPMVPEFWTLDQGALDTWHRFTVPVSASITKLSKQFAYGCGGRLQRKTTVRKNISRQLP